MFHLNITLERALNHHDMLLFLLDAASTYTLNSVITLGTSTQVKPCSNQVKNTSRKSLEPILFISTFESILDFKRAAYTKIIARSYTDSIFRLSTYTRKVKEISSPTTPVPRFVMSQRNRRTKWTYNIC